MKRVKGTHSPTPPPLKLKVALKTEIETIRGNKFKVTPFSLLPYKAAFSTAFYRVVVLLGPDHCYARWSSHSLTRPLPEALSPPPHQPLCISLLSPVGAAVIFAVSRLEIWSCLSRMSHQLGPSPCAAHLI